MEKMREFNSMTCYNAILKNVKIKRIINSNKINRLIIFLVFAKGLSLVNELGRRLQVSSGELRLTAFLTQRITTAIQRGT